MKKEKFLTNHVTCMGMLCAAAMIVSYVETLFPIPLGIPGIKLGLANIMTVFVLYRYGFRDAAAIVFVRIIIIGLLFTNVFACSYSLAGGFVSLLGMHLLKKSGVFSMIGVSVAGGVLHNMAQLLVAILLVKELKLVFYGPVLLVAGCICGLLIGIVTTEIQKRLPKQPYR